MSDELVLRPSALVALDAGDMPGVQSQLIGWCQTRIIQLGSELKDFRQNLRQAKQMHWRRSSWERLISKTKAKMIYYVKVKTAVEAGYVVIPNFPAEILAVRVEKGSGPGYKTGSYPTQINETKPDLRLPPGEGKYVDEMLPTYDSSYTGPDNKVVKRVSRHGHYNHTPDFPMALVKPIILDATRRAMAFRVFDRIGLAHGGSDMSKARRKSDPLVVGQILDPADQYRQKRVTFFVAWWVRVEDI
jgi:hypothetical protein